MHFAAGAWLVTALALKKQSKLLGTTRGFIDHKLMIQYVLIAVCVQKHVQ